MRIALNDDSTAVDYCTEKNVSLREKFRLKGLTGDSDIWLGALHLCLAANSAVTQAASTAQILVDLGVCFSKVPASETRDLDEKRPKNIPIRRCQLFPPCPWHFKNESDLWTVFLNGKWMICSRLIRARPASPGERCLDDG